MKAVEPSGRGVRPGAQGRGLRDLFSSHSGDCGDLGSLYTYASDRASRHPQPHTPFPTPLRVFLFFLASATFQSCAPIRGKEVGGRKGRAFGSPVLTSPQPSRPLPQSPQPLVPEARFGGGVGVSVIVGALGIFLQRSRALPALRAPPESLT